MLSTFSKINNRLFQIGDLHKKTTHNSSIGYTSTEKLHMKEFSVNKKSSFKKNNLAALLQKMVFLKSKSDDFL